jgi:hypothetical protein
MKLLAILSLLAFQTTIANADGICYTSIRDRQGLTCYERVITKGSAETGFSVDCTGDGDKDCKFSDGELPVDHIVIISNTEEQISQRIQDGEIEGYRTTEFGSFSWGYLQGRVTTNIRISE